MLFSHVIRGIQLEGRTRGKVTHDSNETSKKDQNRLADGSIHAPESRITPECESYGHIRCDADTSLMSSLSCCFHVLPACPNFGCLVE